MSIRYKCDIGTPRLCPRWWCERCGEEQREPGHRCRDCRRRVCCSCLHHEEGACFSCASEGAEWPGTKPERDDFARRKGLAKRAAKAVASYLLLLTLASPLAAQEPEPPTWPPPVEEPAEEPEGGEPEPAPSSRWPELAVVAWCEVSGRDAEEPATEGEGEPVTVEDIGCDLGLGLSLYSWPIGEGGRYSLEAVASIGERSVGVGLGWCRGRLCIGLGGAAIRDDLGINTDTFAPVAGATWSFGGMRE